MLTYLEAVRQPAAGDGLSPTPRLNATPLRLSVDALPVRLALRSSGKSIKHGGWRPPGVKQAVMRPSDPEHIAPLLTASRSPQSDLEFKVFYNWADTFPACRRCAYQRGGRIKTT